MTDKMKESDAATFRTSSNKIPFYAEFQEIGKILETIKSYTTSETDTVWAGYDSGEAFLIDLNNDIERIKSIDFETLAKLEMEFGPTSTYQEISLLNGWGNEFLILAEQFDKLYGIITKKPT